MSGGVDLARDCDDDAPESIIYRALKRAANFNWAAPTYFELARLAVVDERAAVGILGRLHDEKKIYLQIRDGRRRVVILQNGKPKNSTAWTDFSNFVAAKGVQ